ncbi:MAG: UPF0149 family protein [Salinisphaeraceae bacterium]|nr:UPF0149 family protein [Salinisphaeraceae bacterium]
MIAYESLEASLSRLGLDQLPPEYHGILCGMLCYRDDAPQDLGLAAAQESEAAAQDDCLRELRETSLKQLQDANIEFLLMLPDDDAPLDARVEALANWCDGFLHGLARAEHLDIRDLSEDAQELVRDFTELSRAGIEADADNEDDERDYAELVEYVRVGAQLMFLEMRQQQAGSAQPEDRLH